MPALDACHLQIVHALEKAGWTVDANPYSLDTTTTTLCASSILTNRCISLFRDLRIRVF